MQPLCILFGHYAARFSYWVLCNLLYAFPRLERNFVTISGTMQPLPFTAVLLPNLVLCRSYVLWVLCNLCYDFRHYAASTLYGGTTRYFTTLLRVSGTMQPPHLFYPRFAHSSMVQPFFDTWYFATLLVCVSGMQPPHFILSSLRTLGYGTTHL